MSILASIGKRLDFYSQACYNIRYGCMKQLETDSRRGGSARQVHHKAYCLVVLIAASIDDTILTDNIWLE